MTGCVILAWLSLALHARTAVCDDLPGPAVGYGASGEPARVWVLRRYVTGLRRGLPRPTPFRATQLFVIAHELGHAEGLEATERGANAWARRNWTAIARRLGATATRADLLWRLLPREWKALPGVTA